MLRPRPAVVAAAVAAALALPAPAQDGYEYPPQPLLNVLVWYADDAGVRQELGLSADQSRQLVAARQGAWDFYYAATPKEHNARVADQDKAVEAAVRKALRPDQLARARQVAAQILWAESDGFGDEGFGFSGDAPPPPVGRADGPDLTRVAAYTLHASPELADALGLSADQKRVVANHQSGSVVGGGQVYLTPAQTAAARAFLGPVARRQWQAADDPRTRDLFSWVGPGGPGGPGGRFPGLLGLTAARDVRAAVGLTDDQAKALAPVREKWRQIARGTDDLSPEQQARRRDELAREGDRELARALRPEQLARLRQIEFRQRAGADVAAFTDPRVAKELAITADQRRGYDAAQKQYADAVARAVADGPGPAAARQAVEAARAARDAAASALLTADQRRELAARRGEPFAGSTRPDPGPGPGFGGGFGQPRVAGLPLRALHELTFGRYTPDLFGALAAPAVRDELKLTADQTARAAAAREDVARRFPVTLEAIRDEPAKAVKLFDERSAAIDKKALRASF